MPFNGLTQEAYAQKMIDEYKAADVAPSKVWPQSFDEADVLYWIRHEPAFGKQAVYLDDANVVADLPSAVELARYKAQGINIWAPPLFALLSVNGNNEIVPSRAAMDARGAGLDIIAWTLERSGILADGDNGFYYQTFDAAIDREGDVMAVLDVLARQVRILGVFSDWPATVTYYANCTGLKRKCSCRGEIVVKRRSGARTGPGSAVANRSNPVQRERDRVRRRAALA